MTTSELLVERDGAVNVWRTNRPDRLNAVTLDMYRALEEGIASATTDP